MVSLIITSTTATTHCFILKSDTDIGLPDDGADVPSVKSAP